MIAGTTAYVYNNTRCKNIARHVVEHMVSIMRLNRHDFYTIYRNALIIKLNVQPQTAVACVCVSVCVYVCGDVCKV